MARHVKLPRAAIAGTKVNFLERTVDHSLLRDATKEYAGPKDIQPYLMISKG